MSFTFEWPKFSQQFHTDAIQLLDAALNKGNKPPIIADRIQVLELDMGTVPPELEVRDIGELTTDQFRGIFRLTYDGDAYIVLRTKVQANPLNHKRHDIHTMAGSMGILAAHQPLVVPMLLRLSHFKLSAYVVLVVSRQKGITLVFKTDPLQNVDVHSTFDSIAVIQKYIQKEIEGQLRNMFREDLPGIIHRLSQRWLAAQTDAKVKVASTLAPMTSPSLLTSEALATLRHHNATQISSKSTSLLSPHTKHTLSRPNSSSQLSSQSHHRKSRPPLSELSAFPDIENYDPTYGMRPDSIPTRSTYRSYADLFTSNKGLSNFSEYPDENVSDSTSIDLIDWDDVLSDLPVSEAAHQYPIDYESFPAVGGGRITRPRIYHSQSMGQTRYERVVPSLLSRRMTKHDTSTGLPSDPSASLPLILGDRQMPIPLPLHSPSLTSTSWQGEGAHSSPFPSILSPNKALPLGMTSPSVNTSSSPLNPPTPPPTTAADSANQEDALTGWHEEHKPHLIPDEEGNIVLRPTLNGNVSHLSALSHSYHTLSPFTRSVEHFAVRSGPRRETSHPVERPPPKAKRKRIYRVGLSTRQTGIVDENFRFSVSPSPPSDCELSDVEHYFRSPSPETAPTSTILPV